MAPARAQSLTRQPYFNPRGRGGGRGRRARRGGHGCACTGRHQRRAGLSLDPWPAAGIGEAWTAFKRERGIELWLEGRRMGDLRRWQETDTPGDLHVLEMPGHPDSWLSADQTLCYDIPDEEREANPNLPTHPGG